MKYYIGNLLWRVVDASSQESFGANGAIEYEELGHGARLP